MREDDTTVLDAADVPVLQVVLSGSAREAWAESGRGLSPADLAMNVVLPGARRPPADARDLVQGRSAGRSAPGIRQRPPPVRAGSRRLRRAPRGGLGAARAQAGRRSAGLRSCCRDYPARGGRTGYAVGLDTTESALEILRLLRAEGYDTGDQRVAGGGHRAAARSHAAPSAMRQGHRAAPARPRLGLPRHLGRAAPRLCRRLCLAARRREDRRADPSRHARHAGMAARQGAGAVGRMLAGEGAGRRCR